MIKSEILAKNTKIDFLSMIDDSLPVASLRLVFRASGAISEKIAGLAKITARILNEGSKSLGVSKFYEKLDIYAINFDIDNGFETFVIEINSLKEHFAFALEMLKDLLSEPNFSDEILEKIKLQTLGEIDMLEGEFDYVAQSGLQKCLYKGAKPADAIIGDKDSISKISLADVREFYASLTLANAYVVVVGDIEGIESSQNPLHKKIVEILKQIYLNQKGKSK